MDLVSLFDSRQLFCTSGTFTRTLVCAKASIGSSLPWKRRFHQAAAAAAVWDRASLLERQRCWRGTGLSHHKALRPAHVAMQIRQDIIRFICVSPEDLASGEDMLSAKPSHRVRLCLSNSWQFQVMSKMNSCIQDATTECGPCMHRAASAGDAVQIKEMDVGQLREVLKGVDQDDITAVQLIDVREEFEHEIASLPGFQLLPLSRSV